MKEKTLILTLILLTFYLLPLRANKGDIVDYKQIENLTGVLGKFDDEGNFIISVPHKDIKVSSMGIKLNPSLGLASTATFKTKEKDSEVIGDLVLFESQVNSILKTVIDNNFEVISLNNPYMFATPKIYTLQIKKTGTLKDLGTSFGKVIEGIKKSRMFTSSSMHIGDLDPQKTSIDFTNVEGVLKTRGQLKDGVYKIFVKDLTPQGIDPINPNREWPSWIAFLGSNKQAGIVGILDSEETEFQNVLKKLVDNHFKIHSIQIKKQDDNKSVFVIYFMKQGHVLELAEKIRDVLYVNKKDEINPVSVEDLPVEKVDRIRRLN